MLLAMPVSKRIASRMAQIAANAGGGPQSEAKTYQQEKVITQILANRCKPRKLPCQGRGRGFESLRPLQNFPNPAVQFAARSTLRFLQRMMYACSDRTPARDRLPWKCEVRGGTMRLKFWPVALVAAAVLVSGWRTDASAQSYPDRPVRLLMIAFPGGG